MPKNLVNIKEDILMVTRNLLSEGGYANLNIRAIASKCGVASGTLYNYYDSKREIVEEILKNEWNMMLRRIDQASKADVSIIEKLETVYNELSYLMNNVHNIWFESSSLNNDDIELSKIKCNKKVLIKSLSDKLLHLIGNGEQSKDYEFLSDVICKLFVSYVYEGDIEFKKLEPVIASLLK